MKQLCVIFFLSICCLNIAGVRGEAPSGKSYVYVSLDSLHCISIFRINQTDGNLSFVKNIDAGGEPGALAVDPGRRILYAAVRNTHRVLSFKINGTNGELELIGSADVKWNPVYLAADKTGRYLFTAHFGDNKASVYKIGNDGVLLNEAIRIIDTPRNPHSIQTDPSNRFLFIPCMKGESVLQYQFSAADGGMAASVPDRIQSTEVTGPRHMAFHPFLSIAYTANELSRSVTVYNINSLTGVLSRVQELSMQPEHQKDFPAASNSGGADIHITPDARFLYSSNRGTNTITSFEVDSNTGLLKFMENCPTEKMPRSFDIDPAGNFLYAGGQASGKVASYRIDKTTGHLTFLKSYQTGSSPVWVSIVQINE